jgi:gamma-glutamyltranspeptidase/glutathione hydrolase
MINRLKYLFAYPLITFANSASFAVKCFLISVLVLSFSSAYSQNIPYENAVVSSANELASEVGIKILKSGGNAIDAAVGTAFALAVVYPQAGNLGGGGFIVLRSEKGFETSIDFRETAPLLASKNMYLDNNGNVIEDLSTTGQLAAGVPGSVAGLLYALEKYGSKSREEILSYSIELAEKGFYINQELANSINFHRSDFNQFTSSFKIFGRKFKNGDLFKQIDLANTLKEISAYGRDGFYKGIVADKIVAEMKNGNGIISLSDLENYKPVERKVIKGTYRGYDIITMGSPSSGGTCLIYLLNILESFDLKSLGKGSIPFVNILAEAMKRVYSDRSEFMGDKDFYNMPVDKLISKSYAKERFENFRLNETIPSSEIKPGNADKESPQTTHLSVADSKGNMVSLTTTLNDVFGSKVVVDGAGFLLNNEMDDFSVKPGVPNIYGLVGNEANAIAPGKRMLSSMTPTIVLKEGKPFLVIGSPGGGKIITAVLQSIINIIDFDMSVENAVDATRFHHQWLPDVLQLENGYASKIEIRELNEMGYEVKIISDFARVEAIMYNPDGSLSGHSDRRGSGKALGF